jgi:hypothetical protein
MSAPEVVVELARARLAARAAKNWALADELRTKISEYGFEVQDVGDSFEFKLKSPFPIVSRVGDLRKFTDKIFESAIGIIVESYVEDLVLTLESIKKFAPDSCAILVLISGQPDLGEISHQLDSRTFIAQIQEGVGWGEAANAILKYAPAKYVIVMDASTRLLADAVTPTITKLEEGSWAAVGWRGGLVNTEDEWRSVDDKGPGQVDVLFGYFMGLNRESAIECGGFNNRAIYYRNADMEFSLRLRQAHGKLLQIDLPLEQARHHGYYDTDPTYRDEQSKKNYDRILERFRGKNEILVERR